MAPPAPYPAYAMSPQPQQQAAYYAQPAPQPQPQLQPQQPYYGFPGGAPLQPSAAYLPAPPLPYYAPQLHQPQQLLPQHHLQQQQQQQQQQQPQQVVSYTGPPLEPQARAQPPGGESLSAAVSSYLTSAGDGRARGQSAGALAAAELRQGSGLRGAYGH
jgi:hypothetical protein